MTRKMTETQALFKKAKQYMPYGVNSNFRYWGDEHTLVATKGEGAFIWDADGNRYIDYRLGFGPIILGHAHPRVIERVAEAMRGGTISTAVITGRMFRSSRRRRGFCADGSSMPRSCCTRITTRTGSIFTRSRASVRSGASTCSLRRRGICNANRGPRSKGGGAGGVRQERHS